MYFPMLRGKLHELMVVRELAQQLVQSGLILPVIEPVSLGDSARTSYVRYVESNVRFALITNPRVGDLANNTAGVDAGIINSALQDYDNFVPSLFVDSATTIPQVDRLVSAYGDVPVAVVYDGQPSSQAVVQHIANRQEIQWHVFIDGRTSAQFIGQVPLQKRVAGRDCFNRRARNADYPPDEFFSDAHRLIPNNQYVGFGDYSIAGNAFAGGGPAYAVTLHHVYIDAHGSLRIKHFISDRTDSTADPSGKFLESLAKLVAALPALGRVNHTPTCDEYIQLYTDQRSPGLGYAKRMAMRHHFELMLRILGSAAPGSQPSARLST